MSTIIERLIGCLDHDGTVSDVRVGALWTAVVVEVDGEMCAGLASTQLVHNLEHGTPDGAGSRQPDRPARR